MNEVEKNVKHKRIKKTVQLLNSQSNGSTTDAKIVIIQNIATKRWRRRRKSLAHTLTYIEKNDWIERPFSRTKPFFAHDDTFLCAIYSHNFTWNFDF